MFEFLRDLRKSDEEKRQELLTAYLDGKLSSKERRSFEQLLKADDSLRIYLEQQQSIKEGLQLLPRIRAPRSFTLDPALYGRPQPQPKLQLYPALRVATVLAAFVFVALVSVDLFMSDSGISSEFSPRDEMSALSQLEADGVAEPPAAEPEMEALQSRSLAEEEAAIAVPAEEPQMEEIEEVVAEEIITEAEAEAPRQPTEDSVVGGAAPAAEEPVSEEEGEALQYVLPQVEAGERSDAVQGTIAATPPLVQSPTVAAQQDSLEEATDEAVEDDEIATDEATSEALMKSPDQRETEEPIASAEDIVTTPESAFIPFASSDSPAEPDGETERPSGSAASAEQASGFQLSPLILMELALGSLFVFLLLTTIVSRRRANN